MNPPLKNLDLRYCYNPNPTADNVTIFVNNNQEYELNILSLEGSLISSEGMFSDNKVIDVSQLAEGIYFVELTNVKTNEKNGSKADQDVSPANFKIFGVPCVYDARDFFFIQT